MPRARASRPTEMPQRNRDAHDVLTFLEKFPLTEFTSSQIARGSGIPDNYRISRAISLARVAAELRGARIEDFSVSKDPARNGAWTVRYIPEGKGDAYGAHDANRSSRTAITYVENARRACEAAAKNPSIPASAGYKHVGTAFGTCVSTIESIQELTAEIWETNRKLLEAAALIAAYQADDP